LRQACERARNALLEHFKINIMWPRQKQGRHKNGGSWAKRGLGEPWDR
jgi:hypothetical protein